MAILLTKTIALEIAYIRAESNSTACDFRITWNGHDFISKEAVNHQGSGQVQGGVSFRACDLDDNCLCKAIRQELSASEPVYWTAAHGSVGVAMFPCDAPPWLLFQWITPEGRKWMNDDLGQHEGNPTPADPFTLMVSFSGARYLKGQEKPGEADFSFTFYTTRRDLESFLANLTSEYRDCRQPKLER